MRARFDHVLPPWVDADATFFVTLNTAKRGTNQLCHPSISTAIFEATDKYQKDRRWFCEIILLMPDHLHMIVSLSRDVALAKTVGAWKQWLGRKHGILWQENFFDHRLRSDESADEKIRYILDNPVRAGLVKKPEDWPWGFVPGA